MAKTKPLTDQQVNTLQKFKEHDDWMKKAGYTDEVGLLPRASSMNMNVVRSLNVLGLVKYIAPTPNNTSDTYAITEDGRKALDVPEPNYQLTPTQLKAAITCCDALAMLEIQDSDGMVLCYEQREALKIMGIVTNLYRQGRLPTVGRKAHNA